MQMGLECRRKQTRARPNKRGDWSGWMTLVWLELGRGWPQPPAPTSNEEKGQKTVLATCTLCPGRAGATTVGTGPASSVSHALGALKGAQGAARVGWGAQDEGPGQLLSRPGPGLLICEWRVSRCLFSEDPSSSGTAVPPPTLLGDRNPALPRTGYPFPSLASEPFPRVESGSTFAVRGGENKADPAVTPQQADMGITNTVL